MKPSLRKYAARKVEMILASSGNGGSFLILHQNLTYNNFLEASYTLEFKPKQ